MTDTTNTHSADAAAMEILYAKLLGETARISWAELQPFFARGALLWVSAELDLVAVAVAVAQDDKASIAAWLAATQVGKLEAVQASDWLERDPPLWTVVVAPWVLVQERGANPALH
ncbi:MAG: DUF2288 domain-containing protein [Pseudomonas sp.]|uniref:DUF2288 domain-containing protein n=1 Tax=Pseudomonas sp. TaxID=306 RepID=UPI0027351A90|nr:DUF2288 domain-containing protein [Pseudomonas sp.]MDP3845594.1 DUF2288 domain-containing protein [Pseudomonas sp.]